MIGLGTWLYSSLSTDETLQALVADRIYPQRRSSGAALPCITYEVVSTTPTGVLAADTDSAAVHVQLDCWATTYASASTLADQLGAVVESLGAGTAGGWHFSQLRQLAHAEDSIPMDAVDGSDRAATRVRLEYLSIMRR